MTREELSRGVVVKHVAAGPARAIARTIPPALALALVLGGCSLDLDRLRAGAGDAAIADATVGDAGAPDGSVPPNCGCDGAGPWHRSSISFPGAIAREVAVVDLDRDGDLDFLAAVDGTGGSPVAVLQLPRRCESPTLDLFAVETHLPMSSTPVAFDSDPERPLALAVPDETRGSLVVHEAVGRDETYALGDPRTIPLLIPARTAFAFDVFDSRGTEIVLGTEGAEFLFVRGDRMVTGPHPSFAPIELAAFDRVSTNDTWLFGGERGADAVQAIRFVSGIPALPVSATLGDFALRDVIVADLNDDGANEVFLLGAAVVQVRRVSGGTLGVVRDLPIASGASAIAAADLDGDGRLDLAAARPGANSIDIYAIGDTGTTSLSAAITLEAPTSIVARDVDGDGRADLIVGHALVGQATLTVMRQQCRP